VTVLLGAGRLSADGSPAEPEEGRLLLRLAGGWGRYEMASINEDYIDGFARPAGIFTDRLDNGLDVSAEVAYSVRPSLFVGLTIAFLRTRTGDESDFLVRDQYGTVVEQAPFHRSIEARAVCPELRVAYHSRQGGKRMFVGAGVVLCLGSARYELDLDTQDDPLHEEHDYSATGVGASASFGGMYDLTGWLSAGVEFGYRHLSTGDLEDNGEEWVVEGRAMNLQFTGPYLLATVAVRP
jgi:hypothetical protein